jgi:hypothetical protein
MATEPRRSISSPSTEIGNERNREMGSVSYLGLAHLKTVAFPGFFLIVAVFVSAPAFFPFSREDQSAYFFFRWFYFFIFLCVFFLFFLLVSLRFVLVCFVSVLFPLSSFKENVHNKKMRFFFLFRFYFFYF